MKTKLFINKNNELENLEEFEMQPQIYRVNNKKLDNPEKLKYQIEKVINYKLKNNNTDNINIEIGLGTIDDDFCRKQFHIRVKPIVI
jgi:hypothetical protein